MPEWNHSQRGQEGAARNTSEEPDRWPALPAAPDLPVVKARV